MLIFFRDVVSHIIPCTYSPMSVTLNHDIKHKNSLTYKARGPVLIHVDMDVWNKTDSSENLSILRLRKATRIVRRSRHGDSRIIRRELRPKLRQKNKQSEPEVQTRLVSPVVPWSYRIVGFIFVFLFLFCAFFFVSGVSGLEMFHNPNQQPLLRIQSGAALRKQTSRHMQQNNSHSYMYRQLKIKSASEANLHCFGYTHFTRVLWSYQDISDVRWL